MFSKTVIGVPISLLNLSYKMYVPDIVLHNIPHFDKSGLSAGGNVLDVPLKYGYIRNHYLIQKSFAEKTDSLSYMGKK